MSQKIRKPPPWAYISLQLSPLFPFKSQYRNALFHCALLYYAFIKVTFLQVEGKTFYQQELQLTLLQHFFRPLSIIPQLISPFLDNIFLS